MLAAVRCFPIAIALMMATIRPGTSQNSTKKTTSADPEARRDELARVKEALADRDPLMRLANLEAIISSGDALKTQVALRLAFQGDDADLHALAMRGYIASRKEVIFDIQLPAAVQRQYEEAQADPDRLQGFWKVPGDAHYYVRQVAEQAFRVHYVFSKYDVSSTTGVIADSTQPNGSSSFFISGDRLAASVRSSPFGSCNVDFRPFGSVFKGFLACDFSGYGHIAPKLEISAPIF
jgi:hypothetical protein